MSKSKHTPGPWAPAIYNATATMIQRLKEEPQAAICLNHGAGAQEMLVALCGDYSDRQSRADSIVIAAAPEMLHGLKMLVFELLMDDMSHYGESQAAAIYRAQALVDRIEMEIEKT